MFNDTFSYFQIHHKNLFFYKRNDILQQSKVLITKEEMKDYKYKYFYDYVIYHFNCSRSSTVSLSVEIKHMSNKMRKQENDKFMHLFSRDHLHYL